MEKQFQTISHQIWDSTPQGIMSTYFKMYPGDAMTIRPHQLNPFLRALEALDMKCLIELNYGMYDKKPYYIIRKYDGIDDPCDTIPKKWQINLVDNTKYKDIWDITLNYSTGERSYKRKEK